MAKNVAIRKEVGLYGIALRAAEKAKAQIGDTIDKIHESGISTSDARYRATEGLARADSELHTAIVNLEAAIRRAESLDEQIEREAAFEKHLGTLGSATAAALRNMTPLERSRIGF